jgi:hypothetical protein
VDNGKFHVCWTWNAHNLTRVLPSVSSALRLRQRWTQLVLQIVQVVDGQSAVHVLVQRWAAP